MKCLGLSEEVEILFELACIPWQPRTEAERKAQWHVTDCGIQSWVAEREKKTEVVHKLFKQRSTIHPTEDCRTKGRMHS